MSVTVRRFLNGVVLVVVFICAVFAWADYVVQQKAVAAFSTFQARP